MNQMVTLENALMKEMVAPLDRTVRLVQDLKLPKNTTIVSADSHWEVAGDIFYERLPAKLKDKAPRVWLDRIIKMGLPDETGKVVDPFTPKIQQAAEIAMALPGAYDLDIRLAHMDAEGVDKEINFPNMVLAFLHHPDFELREQIYRLYNEYIAERGEKMKNRAYGVGIVSNWWDPKKARAAIQQIKDLGLKTYMLPLDPGKTPDGTKLMYSEAEMDELWGEIDAAGIPLSIHIGESSKVSGRGGYGVRVCTAVQPFVKPLSELIFGGVFDRNPNLQVMFAEGGISWVPVFLQDAEMVYDNFPEMEEVWPKMRPSEYWRKHCYATFMNDQLGLKNLDFIGADRVMWGSDYPHAEGTWGYSQGSIQNVVDAVSDDDARNILGGTAMKLFNL